MHPATRDHKKPCAASWGDRSSVWQTSIHLVSTILALYMRNAHTDTSRRGVVRQSRAHEHEASTSGYKTRQWWTANTSPEINSCQKRAT